ncbi:MAG TPA: adenylosuccinate lyase [Cryomorphaceae bacterium]|nr:adenylosuccinate lyase [Cryomorphaceae bacterium]|tara:strand:- start:1102 stop:2451 length:1350 start_codon:yes stop_codon:yes gene_type:complete
MSTSLHAITPIDGRYASKTSELTHYFSEFALIKYRVHVEIEYFIALCETGVEQLSDVDSGLFESLRDIYRNFQTEDAQKIKDIEKLTNHDVKAVEYFIKDEFERLGLNQFQEFIHFGLTSQDINNTAVPLSIKDALNELIYPQIEGLIESIDASAAAWAHIPLLARTHGQPASPTTLGKEFKVFTARLGVQLEQLKGVPHSAKFGGATGNFNAHTVAYPGVDWHAWGDDFVGNYLGLSRSYPTTQIEHYDNLAAQFDAIKRINNIFIDLCRDVWTYVSMDYFKQKIKKGEVGSSAMPHKVNPIDFENAEGNLGLANALLEHLAAKLPISRLQRDLTDSTVLRNLGVPYGHLLIAIASINKGLGKLLINEAKIAADLESNWVVVAEAIQNILRREGYPKPYEALKELTRTNSTITAESISVFIDTLEVDDTIKAQLKAITPSNYIGQLRS